MGATGLKNFILVEVSILLKKLGIENAEISFPYLIKVIPFVGDLLIGEGDGLFFHLNFLVCIINFAVPNHQCYFVKILPFEGHYSGFSFKIRLKFEDVEMPHAAFNIIWNPCKFSFVKSSSDLIFPIGYTKFILCFSANTCFKGDINLSNFPEFRCAYSNWLL
jgi:hypothetical protein